MMLAASALVLWGKSRSKRKVGGATLSLPPLGQLDPEALEARAPLVVREADGHNPIGLPSQDAPRSLRPPRGLQGLAGISREDPAVPAVRPFNDRRVGARRRPAFEEPFDREPEGVLTLGRCQFHLIGRHPPSPQIAWLVVLRS